jgi:hypothetical protein
MKERLFGLLLGVCITFFATVLYNQSKVRESFDEVYNAVDSLSEQATTYEQRCVYYDVKKRMIEVRLSQLK